jgi:hypothetical protein
MGEKHAPAHHREFANLRLMSAARAWPDAPIGQQAVSQLIWGHNVMLLINQDNQQRIRDAHPASLPCDDEGTGP